MQITRVLGENVARLLKTKAGASDYRVANG
jgi:hypothetical protein